MKNNKHLVLEPIALNINGRTHGLLVETRDGWHKVNAAESEVKLTLEEFLFILLCSVRYQGQKK
tara:strand:+ start:397 stop:588 length:192 start_codon:yes stop_codon:yes gene_type:complete